MKKHVNIYLKNGVYYANFRTKRNVPGQGLKNVQVNRSTGSADRVVAQRIADNFREQERLGLFDLLPKFRDDCPKIGALVDAYSERSGIRTAGESVRDFLTVVAEGSGLVDFRKKDRTRVENEAIRVRARELRAAVLTADLMIAFRDRKGQDRTPDTINKMMRTARSLFSRRAMEYYRHLKLPDVSDWLKVAPLAETTEKGFQRIPEELLARMDAGAKSMLDLAALHRAQEWLSSRWMNAWACYWLMRRCGLRNIEVENLRWEWFSFEGEKIWLNLIKREYWKPKKSSGRVPVAVDLYNSLVEHFGPARPGPEGFVLKGSQTSRRNGTHKEVNEYLRQYLPDGEKAAYQLRKQWGSDMAREYGIETAARLLRHKGLQVAYDHYLDDIKTSDVAAA